jgi:cyclopropane fatty-acyl-phospholipid synthase-like methyltransferase
VVKQWSRTLRKGAAVIELACGGGYPVTRALNSAGLKLWAVDSSPSLVTAFQSRFPDIPIQCAKVQESDFFRRKYEGAIAIGLIFLLSEREQANLISRVSEILEPGGKFLLMAPTQTGTWSDMNTGHECVSLGQDRYSELMTKAGLRVVETYMDVGNNHYYDAEKY